MPEIIQFLGYVPFKLGKSFSQQLRAFRMIKGLSQKECARLFGVDPTTLRNWETEKSTPYKRLKNRVESVIEAELSSTHSTNPKNYSK